MMQSRNQSKKPGGRLLKAAIGVLSVMAIVVLTAAVFQKQILTVVATKMIQERFLHQAHQNDDGLYAGLAGTGAPFPDTNRVGPCIVVEAGGRLYVVDAGPGSHRNIGLMGFDIARVEAIL